MSIELRLSEKGERESPATTMYVVAGDSNLHDVQEG
jgi:hypothetical protein